MISSIDAGSLPEPFKTRVIIWRHTEKICDQIPMPLTSQKLKLDLGMNIEKRYDTTKTRVVDTDAFVAARSLLQAGLRIAVLNLGDSSIAGGNVSTGSGCQEESLFRRSTLCRHLDITMYPLDDSHGIYSENVVVFRDTEAEEYKLIKPFKVDVLTVPGVRHPKLLEDGHMSPEDIERMENKIRLMYQMAVKYSVDRLVLGASSCGAWKGKPEDIAEAFRKVGSEYDGVCEKVVFAIMRPTAGMLFGHRESDAKCNYETFKRILEPDENQSV